MIYLWLRNSLEMCFFHFGLFFPGCPVLWIPYWLLFFQSTVTHFLWPSTVARTKLTIHRGRLKKKTCILSINCPLWSMSFLYIILCIYIYICVTCVYYIYIIISYVCVIYIYMYNIYMYIHTYIFKNGVFPSSHVWFQDGITEFADHSDTRCVSSPCSIA